MGKKSSILFLLAVVLLLAAAARLVQLRAGAGPDGAGPADAAVQTPDAVPDASPTPPAPPEPTSAQTPAPEPGADTGAELERGLRSAAQSFITAQEGEWAVYIALPDIGLEISLDSRKMVAASLIKLFVMEAAYDAMRSGLLADTPETRQLVSDMITVSSNYATNQLVTLLGGGDFDAGMAALNEYCARRGYHDTSMGRPLADVTQQSPAGENYTSAADCGLLLGRVLAGECVSPGASAEMLGYLKAQTRTGKIPAGLPSGVGAANKTGELANAEHDAAIVFAPGGAYILCVMSNDITASGSARSAIAELSGTVYGIIAAG